MATENLILKHMNLGTENGEISCQTIPIYQ